jgi:hypothetical protein
LESSAAEETSEFQQAKELASRTVSSQHNKVQIEKIQEIGKIDSTPPQAQTEKFPMPREISLERN